MEKELKNLVEKTLDSNFIMTLGTIVDNMPHLCTVFYVTENKRVLYFKSRTKSQHAQSFVTNSNAAISIYAPTSNYCEKLGFQAQGRVERVSDIKEMAKAVGLYVKAFKESETKFEALPQLILESVKSTMFKYTIQTVKVLDSTKNIHTETYEQY